MIKNEFKCDSVRRRKFCPGDCNVRQQFSVIILSLQQLRTIFLVIITPLTMNQPLRRGDSRIAAREFRNEPEL
jgi:hypothetical protein